MENTRSDRERAMREQDRRIKEVLEGIKSIYLVMSGKGGVGKSTVAVNLAVDLARRGHSVGLMDVDLHGPNTLKMLGLEGERMSSDGSYLIPLLYDDNLRVVSMSSLLESSDSAVIWRGPLKIGAIKQFISDVAWGERDYLIIDSPPGTGDEPLTVAQVITGARGIIITTPQELSILDIRKSITFCRQVSMPVIGIIENMSGLICPHCGRKIDLFKAGGGRKAAEDMGVPFIGELPLDPEIVEAGDAGEPYILHHPESMSAKSFKTIVDKLLSMEKEKA